MASVVPFLGLSLAALQFFFFVIVGASARELRFSILPPKGTEPIWIILYVGFQVALWGTTIYCLYYELARLKASKYERPTPRDIEDHLPNLGFWVTGFIFLILYAMRLADWFGLTPNATPINWSGEGWALYWYTLFAPGQIYLATMTLGFIGLSSHGRIGFYGTFGGLYGATVAYVSFPFLTSSPAGWLLWLLFIPGAVGLLASLILNSQSMAQVLREEAERPRRAKRERLLRLEQEERDRRLAEEKEERKRAEESRRQEQERLARAETERLRVEEEERIQAERRRQEEERERFLRSDRHHRCIRDKFVFPLNVQPTCPLCGGTDIEEILAAESPHVPMISDPSENGDTHDESGTPLDSVDTGELQEEIRTRLEHEDFIGLGNLALETILRPGQVEHPDSRSKYWISVMGNAIATKFDIPATLTYCQPHRDLHLPHHLRGEWKADIFPSLAIFAYVLGATWHTLPPPQFSLLAYYKLMAERQTEKIVEVQERLNSSGRRFRPTDV